jgi:hypothetical protein
MSRSIGNRHPACFEKWVEFHQNRAMARHVRAERIEGVARPVVAAGNDYPAGHLHASHAHRRSQLLFAGLGTMLVETQHGTWMVPPDQAM